MTPTVGQPVHFIERPGGPCVAAIVTEVCEASGVVHLTTFRANRQPDPVPFVAFDAAKAKAGRSWHEPSGMWCSQSVEG